MNAMHGEAFVFINTWQAAHLGHVGWGFRLTGEADDYYFGSTDHLWRHPWWDALGWLRYAHVKPSGDVDWWASTGSRQDMMQTMFGGAHIQYEFARRIPVEISNPDQAVRQANGLAHHGWSVLMNNCVHQTYLVLTAYGANLPGPVSPATNLIPRLWFKKLNGDLIDLSKTLLA